MQGNTAEEYLDELRKWVSSHHRPTATTVATTRRFIEKIPVDILSGMLMFQTGVGVPKVAFSQKVGEDTVTVTIDDLSITCAYTGTDVDVILDRLLSGVSGDG